jgi:hypothetical protein
MFFCSLVVDSNSRFTILSQQVNALYEFPVSYNHNILIFQRTFFSSISGVDTLTTFLPPLFVLQRYVIYFDLPNLFQTFFCIPDEIRTHTEWILSPMPLPIGLRGCYSHQYVKEQKNPSWLERGSYFLYV